MGSPDFTPPVSGRPPDRYRPAAVRTSDPLGPRHVAQEPPETELMASTRLAVAAEAPLERESPPVGNDGQPEPQNRLKASFFHQNRWNGEFAMSK